jgi:thiol-disulfide isomerase/thioredoxin
MQHREERRFVSGSVLCASLLVCLGGAGCASTGASEAGESGGPGGHGKKAAGGPISVGEPIPGIVVHAVKGGREIDLGAMKGKVVLLDIWASWCGPCKEELPLLDDMAARLKDKGIQFVAVSIDEEKAAAEAFLSSRPKWTLTVAHDPKGKVPELLQPPKMPTSYLIDGQGVLRYVNAGFERADAKKIEDRLLALAAEGS